MGLLDFGLNLAGGLLDAKSQRRTQNRNVRYQREFAQNSIQWRTDDAIAAGVHPLYAMGANTTSFQPGIPQSGSAAGDAVRRISGRGGNRERNRLENDLIREQIKTSQWRRAVDRSNATQEAVVGDNTVPAINRLAQEIKLGQVDPHSTKNREQSTNIKSPMSLIRIGSQDVWIPIDEIDEFFENPLAIGAATYAYHGNKGVDWPKLARDYTGKKSLRQTIKQNVRKHIPVRVRKKHLLKKYAKPAYYGAMP